MNKAFLFFSIIALFVGCNDKQNKSLDRNDVSDFVPEPDIAERLKYEALQALENSGCIFTEPDTSLSGIKLRHPESAMSVIGDKDQTDSFENYHYCTKNGGETLTLTQYPGDADYQISVFKVAEATKADGVYRRLNVDSFQTEKGISLGMTKQQVTDRLGNCYAALDSTKEYIELFYRLPGSQFNNSKHPTVGRLPVYFASYQFRNEQLKKFEFGYEYP